MFEIFMLAVLALFGSAFAISILGIGLLVGSWVAKLFKRK